jgi:RNA polymerase sigma factor (sigma-70 family)
LQLTLRAPATSGIRRESELVDRARAGDDRAFEELYARYRERIHAFIQAKVRDHGRAEDLAQEVFMSALRQLRANDSEIVFKPWLYTIARNACIDEFRRGARAREVSFESEELLAGSGAAGRMHSGLPTPAAAIESKQSLTDLRGAFDGLNETQHKLLVMREFEGLSYDEIGARLGMTRQMVESGLFRARRKLGEEYDELASGRRCEQIQTAIDAGQLHSARGLGIKLRRRYSRHLSHCQPCRHVAMVAGVDDALLKPRSIADKVAGLLPFPLLRKLIGGRHARRLASRGGRGAGHHAAGGLAGGAGASGAGAAGIGAGQAAALAVLVLGGAGGGLVAVDRATAAHHTGAPAIARNASAGGSNGSGRTGAGTGAAADSRAGTSGAGHAGGFSARTSAGTSTGSGSGRAAGRASGSPSTPGSGSGSGSGSGTGGSGTGSATGSGSGSGSRTGSGSGSGSPTHHRTRTGTTSTGLGSTAGKTVTGVSTTVQKTASGVGKTVSGVGTTVNKTVSGVGTTVNKTVSGVGTTVDKTVSGVGTTVNKTVSGVGKTVQKTVSGVAPGVGTTVSKTTSGVGTTVQKTASGVGTTVQKTTSGVGTTVQKTTSTVGTTVQGTTAGVSTTVNKTASGVGTTVSGLTGGGSSGSSTTTSSTSTNPVSTLLGSILP